MRPSLTTRFKQLLFPLLPVSLLLLTGLAHASGPSEVIQCTSASRTTWVSEAKIRQKFDESQYVKVIFKVSHSNCYEFYAIGKDGSIVEAYYDPVSADLVRFSKVAPDGGFKGAAAVASTAGAVGAASGPTVNAKATPKPAEIKPPAAPRTDKN